MKALVVAVSLVMVTYAEEDKQSIYYVEAAKRCELAFKCACLAGEAMDDRLYNAFLAIGLKEGREAFKGAMKGLITEQQFKDLVPRVFASGEPSRGADFFLGQAYARISEKIREDIRASMTTEQFMDEDLWRKEALKRLGEADWERHFSDSSELKLLNQDGENQQAAPD